MSKPSKGNFENSSENFKAKSRLNGFILFQGWFEFSRHLEYKADWMRGKVVSFSPRNTSKQGRILRLVSKQNRKLQSDLECVEWCYKENTDVNASRHILAALRTGSAFT